MQPPASGGCSRSTASPRAHLGAVPLVLGQMCPPNPSQNASSSLQVLIHLKSQACRTILLWKGIKQGICHLVVMVGKPWQGIPGQLGN